MQEFIDFLVGNYEWFLVISLILIFALIGYLVDTNERRNNPNYMEEKKKPEKKETDEERISRISEQAASMSANKSLNEVVSKDDVSSGNIGTANSNSQEIEASVNNTPSFEVLGK